MSQFRSLRSQKKNQRAKLRNEARREKNIQAERSRIDETASRKSGGSVGSFATLSKEDKRFLKKHFNISA